MERKGPFTNYVTSKRGGGGFHNGYELVTRGGGEVAIWLRYQAIFYLEFHFLVEFAKNK